MVNRADIVPQMWLQAWRAGLSDDHQWHADQALANLNGAQRVIVNGWLTTLHYVGEHFHQFHSQPRTALINAHCSGTDATAYRSAVTAARSARAWELREQWINSGAAWRESVAGLFGEQCVDAHLGIARSLFRSGAHMLAETYLQTVIRDTDDQALRRAAVEYLQQYYSEQQVDYAAIQLAAYVALRWQQPPDVRKLVHALLDGGQDRAGVDIALVTPGMEQDSRVRATLVKLGWTNALAVLAARSAGPRFSSDAFARLHNVRQVPVSELTFGGSVLLHDRLLGQSLPRLVATPAQPVAFTVQGPVRLRISARPFEIGPRPADSRAWAEIGVNGARYPVAIDLQTAIARYEVDAQEHTVGALMEEFLDLEAGAHRIQLSSDRYPMAVELRREQVWSQALHETLEITDPRVTILQDDLATEPLPVAEAIDAGQYAMQVPLPTTPAQHERMLRMVPESRTAARQLMRAVTHTAAHHHLADWFIQRGEWLAHRHLDDREMVRLRSRLRSGTSWQNFAVTRRDAGTHVRKVTGFHPESEFWRARNLLLPTWRDEDVMLDSGRRLDLAFDVAAATRMRIRLAHVALTMGVDVEPVAVALQHNGRSVDAIELAAQARAERELELLPGEHQIAVVTEPFASQSLLKLTVEQELDGRWHSIEKTIRRRYLLASEERPLRMDLRGPAWVRMDEQGPQGVITRYQYLEPGEALPPLYPDPDAGAGHYRIAVRRAALAEEEPEQLVWNTPQPLPWPAFSRGLADVRISDGLPGLRPSRVDTQVGQTGAATHSASVAWFSDDEDSEGERFPGSDFIELTWTRRHRDERTGRFEELNGHGRSREDGSSGGVSYFRWVDIEDSPLSLRFDGRLFAQQHDGDTAWSGQLRAALRHGTRANAIRYHNTEFSGFWRHLSDEDGPSGSDPDVYTPYRRDHQHGLRVSHTATWQPYQDAQWSAGLALRTNEMDQFSLDSVRGTSAAYLQFRRLQIGGEVQLIHYLADDDRADGYTVPRLRLRSRWFGIPRARGRWEVQSEARYDMDLSRFSAFVRLLWHFDGGQALDDFHSERNWLDDLLERSMRQEPYLLAERSP